MRNLWLGLSWSAVCRLIDRDLIQLLPVRPSRLWHPIQSQRDLCLSFQSLCLSWSYFNKQSNIYFINLCVGDCCERKAEARISLSSRWNRTIHFRRAAHQVPVNTIIESSINIIERDSRPTELFPRLSGQLLSIFMTCCSYQVKFGRRLWLVYVRCFCPSLTEKANFQLPTRNRVTVLRFLLP